MTILSKPVHRITRTPLNGEFGPDKDKRLVVTLVPGNGKDVGDMFELRPLRSRGRIERIGVMDVYKIAMRYRINRTVLEKARAKKERKAQRLASLRVARAERRLFKGREVA